MSSTTDWLMVIITTIYVIATIFICYFNGKSANAAKKQTEEMIRQYNMANRPNVTIRFDIIRSGLLCFVVENEGNLPAHNVNIKLNTKFIEGMEDNEDKERLQNLADSELYLASKQKIYICLGGQPYFKELAKNIAEIDIFYDGYKEHTSIDLNQYVMLLVYASPLEDISQHMKKIKENEESFQKDLIKTVSHKHSIENVVLHMETEDEANKYRIFKKICCERNQSAKTLSESCGLDVEYIWKLLIELEKVDGLIGSFGGFEIDDYDIKWHKK